MPDPYFAGDDAIIARLGLSLLCDLDAIAFCCDSTEDGKMACLTPLFRRNYEPGGDGAPLVEMGCIILGDSHVALHRRRMSNLRMTQTGRRVLRRCAALGMDLRAIEAESSDV